MRQVGEHFEISADEARQSCAGRESLTGIALFAFGLLLLAGSAFILISLAAQA